MVDGVVGGWWLMEWLMWLMGWLVVDGLVS